MADETTSLLVTYVEEAKRFNDVGGQLHVIRDTADSMLTRINAVRDKLSAKAENHSKIVNAILNGNVTKIKVEFFGADPKIGTGTVSLFSLLTARPQDIDEIERILKDAFEGDIAKHIEELRRMRETLREVTTDILPVV